MQKQLKDKILKTASEMRIDVIKMTYLAGAQGAHIGGSLSTIEIIAVLYTAVMHIDSQQPLMDERDRFILSKGHGAIGLYAALRQAGYLTQEELWTYKTNDSIISAHPSLLPQKGMEFASGSLGQGLSLGVGTCLAMKYKGNNTSKVYVMIGDGECDEGSVWEAASSANHYNLSNLICIVDKNGLQYDGLTTDILNMDNLAEKWKSFGWEVRVIDGHDIESVYDALTVEHKKPLAIIANTVKGKGVSFAENNYKWHNAKLTKEQYEQALAEQGVIL